MVIHCEQTLCLIYIQCVYVIKLHIYYNTVRSDQFVRDIPVLNNG